MKTQPLPRYEVRKTERFRSVNGVLICEYELVDESGLVWAVDINELFLTRLRDGLEKEAA